MVPGPHATPLPALDNRGGDGAADLVFVHLKGSRTLIGERVAARQGHFMPPSLLDSQLAILEAPYDEARAIIIDGNQPFDAVIRSIAEKLEQEA